MSDILKVTTPTSGYENSTRTNPISTNDSTIQNIVDPTKATRPDNRSGHTENQEGNNALFYKSNFEQFMKLIKDVPKLTEMFSNLMFFQMETMVSSGINENVTEEIMQFMNMIKMSENELLSFLKKQGDISVRFGGVFFDILKSALAENTSSDKQTIILDFLKKYNDLVSNKHVLQNIMGNLNNISRYMSPKFRLPLEEMINKMDVNLENGDTSENMNILRNEIVPYLSDYIRNTHDMGKIRDLITLLTLNTARYENGDKESFISAFRTLMGFNSIREKLGNGDVREITDIMLNFDLNKSTNHELIDKLISIIENGMVGKAGLEHKEVFQNIVSSILINESVYMPLVHFMIPAEVNGGKFFSEIWIDPNEGNSKDQEENEKRMKFLIKFDIKDLGFFDLIMLYQKEKIELQIYCPEQLMPMEKVIKGGLDDIMKANGISFHSIYIEKMKKPKTLSEVFPKIHERKNAINVKI